MLSSQVANTRTDPELQRSVLKRHLYALWATQMYRDARYYYTFSVATIVSVGSERKSLKAMNWKKDEEPVLDIEPDDGGVLFTDHAVTVLFFCRLQLLFCTARPLFLWWLSFFTNNITVP